MPRVHHVKKARKERPQCGVAVGDSYYHWSFRLGSRSSTRCSKKYPRASQLTLSEFWIEAYSLIEAVEDGQPYEAEEDLEAAKQELRDGIDALRDDTVAKRDAMPENLQDSPTAELLEARIDALEQWDQEVDGIEVPAEEDFEDRTDFLVALENAATELAEAGPNCD